MSYTLTQQDGNIDATSFVLWIGNPQKPRWVNETVVRLGASAATTQVINRRSDPQTSVATSYYLTFAELETAMDILLQYPMTGRFDWSGPSNLIIERLIITDVQFGYTKGKYTSSGDALSPYDWKLETTLTYIVDAEEPAA